MGQETEVAFVFEGVIVSVPANHDERPCPDDPGNGPCDHGSCDFCDRSRHQGGKMAEKKGHKGNCSCGRPLRSSDDDGQCQHCREERKKKIGR